MAIEHSIDADDGWYIGEDKVIVAVVYSDQYRGSVENITDWNLQFDLLSGRGGDVLFSKTTEATEITKPVGTDGRAYIRIDAADTAGLNWRDRHRFVLRRTDIGSLGILSLGAVVIRDPENA